jgi:cation transport ATPase
MQKFKPLFIELMWLGLILNATVFITIFVFGWTFLSNHFDIRLHETYFTISSWKIVLPLFVFFAFFIFLVKEIRHQFSRKASNIIMLVTGSILILLLATINKQVIISEMVYFGDSAVFPPLSAMSEAQMKKAIGPAIHVVSNSLTVIQFLVTASLLYVAFKMGRNHLVPADGVVINNNNHSIVNNNGVKPPKVQIPQAKPRSEEKAGK